MAQDKAMLSLGGITLLARAVGTLRTVAPEVFLLGPREHLEGADGALPDVHPGCGPLSGMETALVHLATLKEKEWACFLPVDMPFLPPPFYAALIGYWLAAAAPIAYLAVENTPQPLICLLHVSVLPSISRAIAEERYRVTSVLEDAASHMAPASYPGVSCTSAGSRVAASTRLYIDEQMTHELAASDLNWRSTEPHWAPRHLWFANLNTPQEFEQAETLLKALGSTK